MQRGGEGGDARETGRAVAGSGTAWLRDAAGGSIYLRLSTRPVAQPARALSASLAEDVIAGGYWLRPPAPGSELAIVYSGVVAAEALAAHQEILDDLPGAGLLAVTSADRLNAGWHAAEQARRDAGRDGAAAGGAAAGGAAAGGRDTMAAVEHLLAPLAPDATLITVIDGHPATLSWLGAVRGHRVQALGVEHFGQSGDLDDLYHHYHIDAAAILDACAAACLARVV
jgi:pyruvate dehydrogenase E1 component